MIPEPLFDSPFVRHPWRDWLRPRLYDDTWRVHAVLCAILASIGRKLMIDPPNFPMSRTFDGFVATGIPEPVWGMILLAAGLLGAVTLLLPLGEPRSLAALRLVRVGVFSVALAHATIAGLILWANAASAINEMFALLALLAVGRLVKG